MKKEFRDLTSNTILNDMLWKQWIKEVKKDESRALYLWSTNEAFLTKKKFEDERNSTTQLTDKTWEEKLHSYRKSSRDSKTNLRADQQFPLNSQPAQNATQIGSTWGYQNPPLNYYYPLNYGYPTTQYSGQKTA